MAKRNPKIKSYRRYPWLNIGTIMFGAIFIYLIVSVILYVTATHITSYEVIAGSISGNYRYTALAMKTETVERADASGYVTYYARSGAKTSVGSTVCTISATPDTTTAEAVLTDSDYQNIKSTVKSYALKYDSASFQQIYTLKADLDTYLLQSTISEDAEVGYQSGTMVNAPISGFVVYQVDGMEHLTEANLNSDLFNLNNYQAANLQQGKQVSVGDSLYKLVEGEEWYLYFPLSESLSEQLAEQTTIRFRFLKDDTTFSAGFSIVEGNDGSYGKITLKNSLVRYVTDRYLDIELLLDSQEGLKVPESAISHEMFYKIPSQYVSLNQDNSAEGTIIRETFRQDGSSSRSRVTARIYGRVDGCYVVAPELFAEGDYVHNPGDSSDKYQLKEEDLAEIQGVYNINKGYAVFRIVTILEENEEFAVVLPNSTYGLASHDFIALDASAVTHDDIVY